MKDIKNKKFPVARRQLNFQAFGVKIGIRADGTDFLREAVGGLREIFPDGVEKIKENQVEHFFSVTRKESGAFSLCKDGKEIYSVQSKKYLINYLGWHLRATVAEFAAEKIFLHAGVVGWEGKAIVIPGQSFAGKTTLVAELVRRGAEYYSDEYAVLDKDGFVHPYAKKLSIRGIIDDFEQLDFAVEELNGKKGSEPLPIGMVLIAEYEKGRTGTRIKTQSVGQGTIELLKHSFSLKHNPGTVLAVLSKAIGRGIILKSKRGEAKEFVDALLKRLINKKS